MAVVAAGNEGEADWLADGCLSGAEWDWAISGGVCADQSAALLGDEQCTGCGAWLGCAGSGVDRRGAGEECAVGAGAGERSSYVTLFQIFRNGQGRIRRNVSA